MADVSQIPYIGPYLGYFGVGDPKYTPKEGTLAGRTRVADIRQLRGRKVVPIRPTSEVPRSIIGDQVNQAVYDGLAGWVEDYQYQAGLTNVGPHPPAEVGPLPPPELVNPLPIDIQPPRINLPVDLPEVVVNPPPVSVPNIPEAPAPLEVPLEEVHLDPGNIPNVGIPNINPRPGPGSAPATRSAPRSNPLSFLDPFAAVLLALNPFASAASSPAANLARNPSSFPSVGARPVANPQPSVPRAPGQPLSPGSGTDLFNITSPNPTLSPGLSLDPFTSALSNPQTNQDKCRCDEKKKAKKREPKPPRTVCYRGTYQQRAKGISYHKGEQIPCESGPTAPKAKSVKGAVSGLKKRGVKAAAKYAKRKKAPSLGELARDVLGF